MFQWPQHKPTQEPPPTQAPEDPQDLRASVALAEDLGFIDGQRGDPPRGALEKISATADQAWLLSVTRIEQDIASAEAILHMEEKFQEDATATLDEAQAALQSETQKQNASPAEYSRGIGIFLIVAAACLFISDIPLSLSLVSKGLQLPAEAQRLEQNDPQTPGTIDPYVRRDEHVGQSAKEEEQWQQAVAAGRTITATDLLRKPLTTLPLFWDTYALAFGIGLLGFSLKPILDLVLDDRQETQRLRAKRLLWIVGVVFFVTTFMLGWFRGEMNKQQIISALTAQIQALETAKVDVQLGGSGAVATSTINEQIKGINDQIEQERKRWYATATFILLTTALPLIGAVCFYFGARRVDNAHNVARLQRAHDAAAAVLRTAAERFATARARAEQFKRFLNELGKPEFRETHKLLLQSSYQRSFFHGRGEAEKLLASLPLFGRLQHAFHESLSRRERVNRFAQPGRLS